jgi:hypothetical protein
MSAVDEMVGFDGGTLVQLEFGGAGVPPDLLGVYNE